MSELISAVRGMKDMLPSDSVYWQFVESVLRASAWQYGFAEIRTPVLEKTELFKRAVGEVTDIVEKEMYSFDDRNGDSLSLRPEGTAGCLRAGLEAGLFYNQTQRLWYMGPQFRHERPQKGRLRQFHQFGVEAVGLSHPATDADVIFLSAHIFKQLNLTNALTLELNSLGFKEDRARYRELLVAYFSRYLADLDEDSQRRLHTNPLRILDSKNPALATLIAGAPLLSDSLSSEASKHFERVCDYLQANHINYVVNPRLVRGLDYYCLTVFEWTTAHLGAQATVCAGGRYDGLIEQLGGKPAPGVGFGLGLERVILLLEALKLVPLAKHPDVYVILQGEAAFTQGLVMAQSLRAAHPDWQVMVDTSDGALKNQLKKADKSGARIALVIGAEEAQMQSVKVNYLRESTLEETRLQTELKLV